VVGGVATSGFDALAAVVGFGRSAVGLSGRASDEDMMAGSKGAPLTVGCPVGARLAGGVYLLVVEPRGGKSCWRRTPLYLYDCEQGTLGRELRLTSLLHQHRHLLQHCL
jgi:hypothetical protein